jgi:uncharacterized protein (TIGR02186 family)
MMARLARLVVLLVLLWTAVPASAQVDVVLTNSDPVVAVHSNFRGQEVTLFGAVELPPPEGQSYSIVVVVQGPSTDWVVREKQRRFGFVLNSDSARYLRVPSYYGIFSTRPLEQIGIEDQARFNLSALAASLRDQDADAAFDAEFVRLMSDRRRFTVADRGITTLSPSTFLVRLPIPSDATNGLYLARALVLLDGEIVGETTTRFTVRMQGFERLVAEVARSNPPLYGFATIMIALATGWLGGVLFRR